MPNQLTAATANNKFFAGRNQRKLKSHPEFAGLTHNEIAVLMTDEELAFSLEYVRADCNASQAAFIACWQGDHSKFKSEKSRQQHCSQKGMALLLNVIVSSYLYNLRLYQLKLHNKKLSRTFDSYIKKYEDLRDAAADNDDYSTAVRAHKELGIIYGHTSVNESTHNQSDADLIKSIAGTNAELTRALSKAMGVRSPKVIEGSAVIDAKS